MIKSQPAVVLKLLTTILLYPVSLAWLWKENPSRLHIESPSSQKIQPWWERATESLENSGSSPGSDLGHTRSKGADHSAPVAPEASTRSRWSLHS
jgi:hypothetical protein